MAKITKSSTAEYFAKNLQQVGFSSPLKAVLTTLKEAVDNSLDACEGAGIAPELIVQIEKVGKGSARNTDLVRIYVEDNGPGLEPTELAKVFGQYLASSKFGRGQCSRGQQGIGISAATTWAQLTNAKGVKVRSKTKRMKKAVRGIVDVDIKANAGVFKSKETFDWKDKTHGVSVEFLIDGRVQLNGEGGLITYLEGTTLVNPHLTINYKLLDNDWVHIKRVSDFVPKVPQPTMPHPHTMKLGEFITHAGIYGKTTLKKFLVTGFSRISEGSIKEFTKNGLKSTHLTKPLTSLDQTTLKEVFASIQNTQLMSPSTKSVLTIGEESLSKSILRLGEIDFFSVATRKPKICDFKPVVVEVALARFINRGDADSPIQLIRFANRVPLQFDKASCAITKAIESVNWRSYGLSQPKGSLPLGPYVFAISVVSPFIKFKNASKETIDSSDELVEEIRRACMQAGQRLSRHIKKEAREADLERKVQHISKFGPILVEGLAKIVGAGEKRKEAAKKGLDNILGKEYQQAEEKLEQAESRLKTHLEKAQKRRGLTDVEKGASEAKMDELLEKLKDDGVAEPSEAEEVTEEVKAAPAKKTKTSKKKKSTSKAKKKAKKTPAKKATKKMAKKKTTKKAAKKKTKAASKKKATKKATKKTTKKTAKKSTKKKKKRG